MRHLSAFLLPALMTACGSNHSSSPPIDDPGVTAAAGPTGAGPTGAGVGGGAGTTQAAGGSSTGGTPSQGGTGTGGSSAGTGGAGGDSGLGGATLTSGSVLSHAHQKNGSQCALLVVANGSGSYSSLYDCNH